MIIVFDTETTDLVGKEATPLEKQPHMTEFAAIKLDPETLEEVDRLEFLVNPKQKLMPHIVKITNITDKMLEKKPTFGGYYPKLINFFIGGTEIVAHNCTFDVDILRFELMRIDRLLQFPWPPTHTCTVEQTLHIKGERMSLKNLYKHLFNGEVFKDAHRAMSDVEALTRCYRELKKLKVI